MSEVQYTKQEASVVCLDIRDFSQTLSENIRRNTDNQFYEFLLQVYKNGENIAKELCGEDAESYYINSTGDGFICVFWGKDHYYDAYFMGLVLINIIDNLIGEYSKSLYFKSENRYKFGIGVETGYVVKINAEKIVTYIGDAINLATRIEAITKQYKDTPMIFGEHINKLLCKSLFNKDYAEIVNNVKKEENRQKRKKLNDKMDSYNDILISDFLHPHIIKGYNPEYLFKISISEYTKSDISDFPLLNKIELPLRYKLIFMKYSCAKKLNDANDLLENSDLLKSCFLSYLHESSNQKKFDRYYPGLRVFKDKELKPYFIEALNNESNIDFLSVKLSTYFMKREKTKEIAEKKTKIYEKFATLLCEFFGYLRTSDNHVYGIKVVKDLHQE